MGGFTQRAWVPTKRRGPIAAESASPGPAFVCLPTLIGSKNVPVSQLNRAPAFSFTSRHNEKDESTGPGPAQYDITGLSAKGKTTPLAVSIHSRNKELSGFTTPAPGDYAPEKSVKAILDTSPKYTIGIRSSHEKIEESPGPNMYSIPSMIGACKEGNKRAAPSYSIKGRQRDIIDERVKNPGAGAYDPTDNFVRQRAPAYTISMRYEMPKESGSKPGPGDYAPEKVVIDKPLPQEASFGIKHSKFIGDRPFYPIPEYVQYFCCD